jgi:putative ABC transport system ATP-binding protein
MQLILKNIIPRYLESQTESEIWNKVVAVTKGEHLHVVAPSGKGKSTLVHYIYSLRKDYTGEILLNNENIKNLPVEKLSFLRQQQLSIVFQDLRLFPDLTVRENIELKRRLRPFHTSSGIQAMAARLSIENKLGQKTGTCSYGEQQRVAIIRALMQPFDFLLLDEPFSHLDEENRHSAMELIFEECEKRKASMIFADLKKLDLLANVTCLLL